jgi:hypothetical protein
MTIQTNLFLYEEIMLLALRDEEGTIASGTMYKYAIGAAVLSELLLNKSAIISHFSADIILHVILPSLY